ncbi:hypothetical protein [Candidatus Frankia alpina]|uniref:Uncharacterized protein n=1 Tax=Candidatus Frankia alpina TaxID=2699483 RepID=A0A4S5EPN5_9ACTN|nr:hypothetical protein [Candidatus Frankia alpina]THJ74318.1 hypothetical protein E7Y31_12125 [Candidatus Frankia alpina]
MPDSQALDRTRPGDRRVRRATMLVAGLALTGFVGLTAGCGSDGVDLPDPSASASLPTALPTALPSGLPTALPTALPSSLSTSIPGVGKVDSVTGAAALRGTNVPTDFPVPPGAAVKVGTTTGKSSTVTLSGVSSDRVAAFYRTALPRAGYRITSDVGIPGVARALAFDGHSVTGSIGAAGLGQSNAIAIVFTKH